MKTPRCPKCGATEGLQVNALVTFTYAPCEECSNPWDHESLDALSHSLSPVAKLILAKGSGCGDGVLVPQAGDRPALCQFDSVPRKSS